MMSETARRDFHCDLQIDEFAVGWGAEQLGALVDTARGLYVERARSQSLARRRVALLAVAKVERQSMAPKLKAVSELRGVQKHGNGWRARVKFSCEVRGPVQDMMPAALAVAVAPPQQVGTPAPPRKRLRGKSREVFRVE